MIRTIRVLISIVVATMLTASMTHATPPVGQKKDHAAMTAKMSLHACPKCEMANMKGGKCPGCGMAMEKINGKLVYSCAHCHTVSSKAGNCTKCKKPMAKAAKTHVCDKCHTSALTSSKCAKCGKPMKEKIIPMMPGK